jgi:hypothetical protein
MVMPKQNYTKILFFVFILSCISFFSFAQSKSVNNLEQTFNSSKAFIENIGQYGKKMESYEQMGDIKFGYEGLDMPILFTPKGLIHLQRKIEKISKEEEEILERQGVREEEIERKKNITDRTIIMEWVGANDNVKIVKEEKNRAYHTYGMLTEKAFGYQRITYKNLYDGIDIVYSFPNTHQNGTHHKIGFEYSLIVQPYADLTKVKMKYGGDVKTIKKNSKGHLVVSSDINGIEASIPISYYGDRILSKNSGDIQSSFQIVDTEIEFVFPKGYDHTKAIVIDPFVTATTNLTGVNAGIAKDVDFDYAGNMYVSGGGSGTICQFAKYNVTGGLEWTFNGSLVIPAWKFGPYYGGNMVEKSTGNAFLGQGFNFTEGFRVIRLNTFGLYDNFITNGNPNFRENWKMIWNCNSGAPQIFVAGGGTNSNINLGIVSPPALNPTSSNLTGNANAFQDMVDMVIDPTTNSMYSIFAAGLNPELSNVLFKHNPPYNAGTLAWRQSTGFTVVQEAANRPYLNSGGFGLQENSMNLLAINANYIFYWDGKNLKAFDKVTGTIAGTSITIAANTVKMQGGIVVDACNNVFIGSTNGIIKVYNFNGTTFDDTPADITVAGFGTGSVYDLALDESKKILYASGKGFAATFDVAAYCPNNIYTINVVTNCATAAATASITPTPPAGSTISYSLYIGTTLITTNSTGAFTNLLPNTNYTIVATINYACSGIQTTTNFNLPAPIIVATPTNTTCGSNTGQINISVSGGITPYTYSLDGVTYNSTNPITGLTAGLYTVFVKDNNGCINKTDVTILNSNGPTFTFTQTNATCGNNTGTVTITASGGTLPYQYSINNGTTYQTNNFFTGLLPGTYLIKVKDALGCINTANATIISGPAPTLIATPASATCGLNNGTITAFGGGGTAPLQYSINGNTFQASGVFVNLTPGTYTVTVKDAIGCFVSIPAIVANNPAPSVTATTTPAACGNINGSITASGLNGVAPLTYSINGTTYQTSPFFSGLAAGNYTVRVKDATGCIATTTVIVGSTGGPTASATSTPANCGATNGSITITGFGTAPFTYSINGTTFQALNTFPNLAAGNYFVFVRDAGGCIGAATVVVNAVAGPSISATSTPASCTVDDGIIIATGSGGATPLEYSIDGVNYSTIFTFSNLPSNNYTVYVRDALGCVKTTTVFVNNASNLNVNLSAVNAVCGNNGIITAVATGGVGLLQYNINGGAYQASNIFSNLSPGNYTVTVRDANGCIVAKQAIVNSVTGLSLLVNVPLEATCASANAVIVASGSGGIAPLTYSINGTVYQATGTFINVAAGTYTVYVKDATGCILTQQVTITNTGVGPGITTFTVRVEDAYACNTNLGKIDQFRINGANCGVPCTYSRNFGPYLPATDPSWASLAPSAYYITARDANGCTKTIIATIGQATLSTATYTVTGADCNTSNGSITLTGVGPNTPYHASITGIGGPFIDFTTTLTFPNLAGGTYTIIMADDEDFNTANDPGNCLVYLTIVVPTIGGPTISTTQLNAGCGLANGIITVIGTAGSGGPYNYSINNGPFGTNNIFSNLLAGTYTVGVRDNSGCISRASVIITGTVGPTLTAIPSATSCGLVNGSIQVIAGTTGTPPFTYSNNGTVYQASNIFNDLAVGPYSVYIKDANGCFTSVNVNIPVGTIPKVTAVPISASCNANDGAIFATGTLGVPPYQFSLDGTVYQSSNIFTGLSAGIDTVYMKDSNGCVVSTVITIGNLTAATFTTAIVAARCGNPNGSITISNVLGGTAGYTYSFDGGLTYSANVSSNTLLPGTYTVIVKDAAGCLSTKVVLVGDTPGPQTLTAVVSNATCSLQNGTVTLTATGGTPAYQYSKDGITYQVSPILTGFGSGTFTVYVRDINLCPKPIDVTILNLAAPTVTAIATPTSCGLNDGTITATANGGTLALSYSRDGVTFQPSNIFTGLPAGPYTITVRDAKTCINTTVATVIAPTPITPTFNGVPPICNGATLNALPTTSLNNINGTWSPVLSNTTNGTYTFTPTAGQCANTQTMTIVVNPKPIPIILSSLGTTIQVGQITTFSTSIPYGIYQWYNSGVLIPGAINPTYDVGVQGNYAVEVRDANGCIGISEYFTLIVLDGASYILNGYKQQEDSHFLKWRNAGTTAVPLAIERSIDGIHFTTITAIDNLNQLQYTSKQIFTDPIYYYRLKWKNNINLIRYSNTIVIHGKRQGVQLLLYPNPTDGMYNISSNKLIQQVIILNTIGEIILKDPIAAYQKYYNAATFANGNYVIKVLIDGKWNVLQLMKQ